MIEAVKTYAKVHAVPSASFELQMLYGIRRDLQVALVKEGFNVRIYVPFGAEWYPYFMRRLAERPANAWFLVSNVFKG
jgi:proline dehydrogenase